MKQDTKDVQCAQFLLKPQILDAHVAVHALEPNQEINDLEKTPFLNIVKHILNINRLNWN